MNMADPFRNYIRRLTEVPQHLIRGIERFFTVCQNLEERNVGAEGWEDVDASLKIIEAS